MNGIHGKRKYGSAQIASPRIGIVRKRINKSRESDAISSEGGLHMKKLAMISIIFSVLLGFILAASAGELYVWVDKKGQTHVTDEQPPESAKIVGTDSFRGNSTVESQIQNAQERWKRAIQDRTERYESLKSKERAAREMEADAIRERSREIQEKRKAAGEEWRKERAEDLNARKEILRAVDNRDYSEAHRLRIKNEERKIERDLKKTTE